MRSMVDEHIPHDADVMHAAVGLDGVVVRIRDVVVVEVDRNRPAIPIFSRRIFRPIRNVGAGGDGSVRVSVCLYIDAVMEISNVVIRNNVTWPIELHSNIRSHFGRKDLSVDAIKSSPELWTRPTDEMIWVVPSIKPVVRDVEIARSGIVAEDARADVFEPGFLYG